MIRLAAAFAIVYVLYAFYLGEWNAMAWASSDRGWCIFWSLMVWFFSDCDI